MLDHRLEKSTKELEKICKSFRVDVCEPYKKAWQSIDDPLVKIVKNIEVGSTLLLLKVVLCLIALRLKFVLTICF